MVHEAMGTVKARKIDEVASMAHSVLRDRWTKVSQYSFKPRDLSRDRVPTSMRTYSVLRKMGRRKRNNLKEYDGKVGVRLKAKKFLSRDYFNYSIFDLGLMEAFEEYDALPGSMEDRMRDFETHASYRRNSNRVNSTKMALGRLPDLLGD